MFRLRSKSGDESVFRTAEEIRSALLSGFVTPDAQIWDAELKGWVPLVEHTLYQQIAAVPGGRKSASVKAPPGAPGSPKAPPKLVIKRPGATTAMPAVKPPAPPAPAPPAAPPPPRTPSPEEIPDLELIDLDLTPEPEVVAPPPPPRATPAAPPPRATPPAPPRRPTPAPEAVPTAPIPAGSPRRVSAAKPVSAEEPAAPVAMRHTAEVAASGSKLGLIIGAVVVLAAAGGGFVLLRGKGSAVPPADTTAVASPAPAPVVPSTDSVRDTTAAATTDTAHHDSTATAPPATVTTPPAPATRAESTHVATRPAPDTTTPAAGIEPVAFAPTVDRGPTSWNARPIPPMPLSVPALEVVRSRYAAAQARAAQQFEAALEVAEFADMFNPAKVARTDSRQAAFDAADAARGMLRDFRRKQVALDFAYTDSLRQALPPGSDSPDLRTFGPLLRESAPQAALTDSIMAELVDMYGMLVSEAGGYTLRSGNLLWKDADNATQYQTDQERLTAQLARIRGKSPLDVPPAQAGILRAIGLPR